MRCSVSDATTLLTFIIDSSPAQKMYHSPPIIVRMREACPGQSTRVNCRLSYCFCPPPSRRWSGRSTVKEEKPRSSVIPLSRDWGFLSKAAVDAVLLSALASDVFPLSTCPSTPTLKFSVLTWLSAESAILTHYVLCTVRRFLYFEVNPWVQSTQKCYTAFIVIYGLFDRRLSP